MSTRKTEMVVLGASAGGFKVLMDILPVLKPGFPFSIALALHSAANSSIALADIFRERCAYPVREVEDKEEIVPGILYIAPNNYHLLVEPEKYFSLSVEEPVNFSRPSIDVFFDSAAVAFKESLVGIVLSGANNDGAEGLKCIVQNGGFGIVENPRTAEYGTMPQAALEMAKPHLVLSQQEIAEWLQKLAEEKK